MPARQRTLARVAIRTNVARAAGESAARDQNVWLRPSRSFGSHHPVVAREALVLPLFYEQSYRIARPELEGLSLSLWFPTVALEELRLRL